MKKAFTFQSQVREEDSSFSIVFVFENGGYGASEVGKKKGSGHRGKVHGRDMREP